MRVGNLGICSTEVGFIGDSLEGAEEEESRALKEEELSEGNGIERGGEDGISEVMIGSVIGE